MSGLQWNQCSLSPKIYDRLECFPLGGKIYAHNSSAFYFSRFKINSKLKKKK